MSMNPMPHTVTPYAQRRQQLLATMHTQTQGRGGVAILFTAPEVMRNRDADYPYRHDSYFYYLTGFTEPQSCVVLVAASGTQAEQAILFCRTKNLEREIWDGYRYGPEKACVEFGFDAAYPIEELDERLPALLANQPAVFYSLASDLDLDQRLQTWLEKVRQQSRAGVTAPSAVFDVRTLLDEMRLYKDAHEIALMQRAADISAEAHRRAMRACRPGLYEYEIEAELLHEFRRQGSEFPAYGSIVASGAHACVLHYRSNNAPLRDGDLLLIDAGCELASYASDITRTFPINGKFTRAQQTLYDIVLAAQAAAIAATQPGQHFNQPHEAALRVLAQGMLDTGLLQGSLDEVLESGSYRQFYMHRTSHWLGMDVHDCGEYRQASPPNTEASTDRPWRTLEAGMVLTLEPGIYVRPAENVPEAYWNIGIRIEDDALVTPTGCHILSAAAPKTVAEIETLMRASTN